ncbi:MAG: glycosyltransferase family 1 protein [Nitrospirae bacterium]|nr:MAG: glycosyltransferase family 1 protein [Nitrospirota bacterium]
MHVIVCSTDYPPVIGGIAQYTYQIAKALATHDQVKVLTVRTPGWKEFDKGQTFMTVRVPNIPLLREALFLRAILRIHRTEPIDWIVSAVWFPCGLLAHASHNLRGIKYAVAAHGSEIFDDYVTVRRAVKSLCRAWKGYMFRQAAWVLPVSHYTREQLAKAGVVAPMRVLHNGVDTDVFRPAPKSPALMSRLGLGPATTVLLTVGRLDLHKGHDVVLRALPLVREHIPGIAYVIVGAGPERARLGQLVDRLGLTGIVKMVGTVAEADLVDYYNLCDLFIMPSREMPGRLDLVEGFGIVFLEAGACGKPVIGGNSGGMPDAVLDGVTGLLVDPLDVQAIAQAVVRIGQDQEYARRLGRNGRRRCEEELNWASLATKLHQTLSEGTQAVP